MKDTRKTDQPGTPSSPNNYTVRTNNVKLKILALISLFIIVGSSLFYAFNKTQRNIFSEKSIAVLPLVSLSSDPNNQFFADGLVEDLLTRLSMIEGFKVISRTSSEMYRERGSKSIRDIARELGVSYILEGSVQRDAGKARINVQLIDAHQDVHLWSELFDGDLNDIFKTQSEIAIQIASEMNAVLSIQQTSEIQKNRTSSVKAFELYQLGRFHWNKRTGEGYKTSIKYFEQAIAEDPKYGLAYSGLADTYNLMTLQRWIDKSDGRNKTIELAQKALELDASLAEAHTVLASIYTYVDKDWEGAEVEYVKALLLNPNYSTAHHYYSEQLSITGRHREAREQINKALELNPLSFVIHHVSAKLYYNRGLFLEALQENNRCHELQEDHPWSTWYDFEINYQLGNDELALQGFKHYGNISGEYDSNKADSIYQANGLEGLLRWKLDLTDSDYFKAEYYGLLGEQEMAMNELEKSVNKQSYNAEFTFYIAFNDLHANPRYKAILDNLGLSAFMKSISTAEMN